MSTYTSLNPATDELLSEFPTLTTQGVEEVLERAHRGYAAWRRTSHDERATVLRRVAELYDERAEELARLTSLEMGKPLREARGEIALAGAIYAYYAENGPAFLADQTIDLPGKHRSVARKEPIGALLGIMPWNFPHYQVARFAAPNLMTGNTVILKHAPRCPQSALLIEEILRVAGVPDDAYLNVFATNDQVAEMIADPRVQGVSLTGSERAGSAVAEIAGRNLKKAVLELGGSDAFIVLASADIDSTVKAATRGRLGNTGQACNAAKRIIVIDSVYEEFVAKLTDSFQAVRPGDPLDEATKLGPLSSAEALDGVMDQVEDAVSHGADVLAGGSRVDGPGSFMEATLLAGITPAMRAYTEEIFGPVGVLYRVADEDAAVELANSSAYGLSGSVWSTELDHAAEVADRLEVGMAYVNEHGTTLPGLPFGGVKRSGFGRELGPWGMDEFVNTKLVRISQR